MNPIVSIYNLIFYQPIFNFLVLLYRWLDNFGLAIIFLTVFVRLILFPFTLQTAKTQTKITNLQKELKEIEKKFNNEEKTQKIIEIYKKERINPLFGFLSLFIQLPILIALYQVFLKGVKEISSDPKFLKIFDLSQPNSILAFFVALSQFFYSQIQTPKKEIKNEVLNPFQNQLNYFLSFFTFLILLKLPSAIGVYLIVNFLFLIFQKKIFHA